MDWARLAKDWRMLMLAAGILFSVVFIAPSPAYNEETGLVEIRTNIEKGLDLTGGTRALLVPEEPEYMAEVITKLNVRVNAMGLTETIIKPVGAGYIQVEMAGVTEERIRQLLEQQGKFEAKVQRHVKLAEGNGLLDFGAGYDFYLEDSALGIGNKSLEINDTIELEGVEFQYTNITEDMVELTALVYVGEDVEKVFRDSQHSYVEPVQDYYRFRFTVMLSKDAAEKFAKVTDSIPVEFGSGYLTENIDLYLDGKLVDSLRIGEELRGAVETQIQISGPGESRADAVQARNNLQAVLDSGALPTPIEIAKVDKISASLGGEFLRTAVIAILVAIVAVSILVFARYRDRRIVIPIIITSASEVLMILGFASLIGWTIDLAAIAGIMAAVGTGVDHQIIITDESTSRRKKELVNIKERLRRAFFIIMAAWATTVAAMLPLATVGAGGVKGFAVTTIIGVTIGVLVTRPAYGRMMEFLKA